MTILQNIIKSSPHESRIPYPWFCPCLQYQSWILFCGASLKSSQEDSCLPWWMVLITLWWVGIFCQESWIYSFQSPALCNTIDSFSPPSAFLVCSSTMKAHQHCFWTSEGWLLLQTWFLSLTTESHHLVMGDKQEKCW